MSELWHADISITEELVKKCLYEQFPRLTIHQLRCIAKGWDNKIFLVNETIIFRFPRRKIAVELIERENKVLKKLQMILKIDNFAIPNPKYIGHPFSEYPYPFHGYDMIEGICACHAQLSVQNRIESLPKLATFLKQLHSIDESQALAFGAEPQIFDRTLLDKTITTLKEQIDKIIVRNICDFNVKCLQHEIDTVQDIKLPHDKCLVHGDLYCRHLLFNHGQLVGIIDWGDTGINNRTIDLSVIWNFYPKNCHDQFFEIYGLVDSATWQFARFLALYSALIILLYGHDTKDAPLVKEARDSVRRINPNLIVE